MTEALLRELGEQLPDLLGVPVEIERAALVMGSASKEAWVVDARAAGESLELFVRRVGGGVIYSDTLSLEQEYQVLRVAHDWGVKAPKPHGYLEDLAGR